jgi:poly-gamma-glutamate capsule biosynthesis protein CapA/YwtB (metallophosphatase superfamily)
VRLALAGDTMLGRGVAQRLVDAPTSLVAPDVAAACREADVFVLNLECCISERGRPWPDAAKPFFFRAPPSAVETLTHLGVDCVTLANNHALDFGEEALLDTLGHLDRAGIAHVGAGPDEASARAQAVVEADGHRLAVLGLSDHPAQFGAGRDRPGIAFADLARGVPGWVMEAVQRPEAEPLLVTPHWGPNMTTAPVRHVREAARALVEGSATLVAGHSAHVFHGVTDRVVFDLGDFVDDYAVDPRLRNDLGLLWFVELAGGVPRRLEALPLKLEYCHTRRAEGDDAVWIRRRFRTASVAMGTEVTEEDGRMVVDWR